MIPAEGSRATTAVNPKAVHGLLACLIVLAAGCSAAPDTDAGDLLLANGQVIDPVKGTLAGPRDVLIRSGRIHAVTEPGRLRLSPDTPVRDATGLFLLPGLIDVHAHIGHGGLAANTREDREEALRQFVAYGVTTIFVPGGGGGNDEQLAEWKRRCGSRELTCPQVFGSGDILTAVGSHPITTIWGLEADADPALVHQYGATAVGETDTVEPLIAEKAASGVDAIKIVVDDGPGGFAPKPRLSRAKIAEICNAAHAHGLRVFAHVSLAEHVTDVVASGCDGIMHAPDDLIADEVLQEMAARDFFYVATLSLFDALIDQEQGERVQEPYAIAGVSPKALASFDDESYWSISPESPELIAEWKAAISENLRNASLHGVRIALGTDTNNPQIFPGYSVHEELALMVGHGLSPAEALRAATTTAAAFLEQSAVLGRIEAGYRADIVALARNPLDDVENSRSIAFVLADGRFIDRVVSAP